MTAARRPIGNTCYLLGRAAEVETRIRVLIAHRRQHDPAPDDPFRGLYLTDDAIDALLVDTPRPPAFESIPGPQIEHDASVAEATGVEIRLRSLARAASLTASDVELLVIGMLPDLDTRFERLYGYLNDDVSRRRATVGLALQLADRSVLDAQARRRLSPGAPLIRESLVRIEDADRPFLTRGLRVPDRVVAYLLGDDEVDPDLRDVLVEARAHRSGQSQALAKVFNGGQRLCYVRGAPGSCGAALATAALQSAGRNVLCCDAARLAACADAQSVIAVLGREALFRNAGLVVGPLDELGRRTAEIVLPLTRLSSTVILIGGAAWDPSWSEAVPLVVEAARLTVAERRGLWASELGQLADGFKVHDIATQYKFGPREVVAARQAADAVAQFHGKPLSESHLHRGARLQNGSGLERLTRRVEPDVCWGDLVLAEKALRQLHDFAGRARNRSRVMSDWRMRPGGGRGSGVTALFAGDSGTGKTMAAEVIAADLGLDLYTVSLSTVVDKYVGETEKNLERIFSEAANVNGVLFFDEADAIFGKRSEAKDAHDRYANVESAYLLQRMETLDGLAILATNFRSNLDDAFTRRLDMVVDFPLPDEPARRALWERCLAPPVPRGDVDLRHYAHAFPLSGGNIRAAAITAAYLAAAEGTEVEDAHVAAAIEQEFRKLGRLLPEVPRRPV